MADSTIQLNPGVGGDKVDADDLGVSGGAKRQRTQIGGYGLDQIAEVKDSAAAVGDNGLVVRVVPDPTNRTQIGGAGSNAAGVIDFSPGSSYFGLVVRPVPDDQARTMIQAGGNFANVTSNKSNLGATGLIVRPEPVCSTACAMYNVTASAVAVQLLAASTLGRRGVTIVNDPAGTAGARLYISPQAGVSATLYTEYIDPYESFTDTLNWAGAWYGIWASANGVARIGEWT